MNRIESESNRDMEVVFGVFRKFSRRFYGCFSRVSKCTQAFHDDSLGVHGTFEGVLVGVPDRVQGISSGFGARLSSGNLLKSLKHHETI